MPSQLRRVGLVLGLLLWFVGAWGAPVAASAASADPGPLATTPPPPLEQRPFALPDVQHATLSNGVPVMLVEDHDVPLVWLRLAVAAGPWTDPPERTGLAWASMRMMKYRTDSLSVSGLSAAQARLGAKLGSFVTLDGATLYANGPRANLEPILDLFATVVLEPSYWPMEWKRIRRKHHDALQERLMEPEYVAQRVLNRALYRDPYGGRLPTAESLVEIHPGAMRNWARDHVHPDNCLLLITGDVTLDDVVPMLEERLSGWEPGAATAVPAPDVAQPDETTLYLVDHGESAQSVIALGRFVARRTDPDHAALWLANEALTGSMTGRLESSLRREQGWTYDVSASLEHSHAPGLWRVSSCVQPDVTAQAVTELVEQVRAAVGERPLTADEIEAARTREIGGWPSRFERPLDLLGQLAAMWRHELPEDWLSGREARLRTVTVEDANAALARHLDPDALAIVVVGDLAELRGPLEALGWPTIVVDARGVPVAD